MMKLESKGLCRKYGHVNAVSNVNLGMESGHIYGMLGPNGSGKTTWMKMAAGLVKPTSGCVYFDGDPVSVESRKKVAYMSTEPYFYSWMTAKDVGKYYNDFFADFSNDEYARLLSAMNLSPDMKLSAMSTGMTAKLKIAVTLSRDAEVYMLDEPFNGIDLLARDAIRTSILEKSDENKLILISSHLVEELESIVDRAVFMSEGALIEVRDLEEMREQEGISMADRYRAIYGHVEVN